jgi:hypothetical protein
MANANAVRSPAITKKDFKDPPDLLELLDLKFMWAAPSGFTAREFYQREPVLQPWY